MYILYIVTANDCPACVRFKQQKLNNLINLLNSRDYKYLLDYEHISYPAVRSKIPSLTDQGNEIPEHLQSLVVIFPSLILMKQEDNEIEYFIFNYRFDKNNNIIKDQNPQPLNNKSVSDWLSDCIFN